MGGEYRSNPNGSGNTASGVIDCSANDTIKAYYLISSSGRKFNGGSNPGTTGIPYQFTT